MSTKLKREALATEIIRRIAAECAKRGLEFNKENANKIAREHGAKEDVWK